MKRFARLLPMLLAFAGMLALVAGAVYLLNTFEASLVR